MKDPKNEIETKLASYPANAREKIDALRTLILDTAKSLEDVGHIEETLKWGELAYLTPDTLSGSTIRLDWKPQKTQ